MRDSSSSNETALQLFGAKIRARRRELRLSQQKVADLTGIDRTYIGDIERGEGNPSLTKILSLAAALGVPPSGLLSGLDQRPDLYQLPS
jgi:transcriptional regulator with XRE-family HTH domain